MPWSDRARCWRGWTSHARPRPPPPTNSQERARQKDAELAALTAEMERRKGELDVHSAGIQAAIAERAAALAGVNSAMAAGNDEGSEGSLLDQKLRLEREKAALEKSVKELTESSHIMRRDLDSTEEMRKKLQDQFESLSAEDTDLLKERQMRKRLEKKLQIAESSLKRLDAALKRNGVKMDVDVFADVKTLMTFFEERCVPPPPPTHTFRVYFCLAPTPPATHTPPPSPLCLAVPTRSSATPSASTL